MRFWEKLSARERRLAVVVAVLVGLAFVYAAVAPALGYLQSLSATVDSLEEELYSNTVQASLSKVVSARYATLAAEHSTEMTEAQISDGLQSELDRLSLQGDPAKGGAAGHLVRIVYRPEGTLTDYEGYREYQTTFTTQPTTIQALSEFLARLQQSPQALRVDRLDLRRENPAARSIVATIAVTRTVVDRPEGEPKPVPAPAEPEPTPETAVVAARNPSFEQWDAAAKAFPEWKAEGCTVEPDAQHAVEGANAAKVVATEKGARFYQNHELVAGRTYRLSAVLAAQGKVTLAILDAESGRPLGQAPIAAGDTMLEVKVPKIPVAGRNGEAKEYAIPCLILDAPGDTLFLDKVVVEEVGG